MAQVVNLENLKAIIRHEIGELKRLRRDLSLVEHIPSADNFSLMVLYSEKLSPETSPKYLESISKSMREADAIAYLEPSFIFCMLSGTNKEGAIHLAEGIKDFLGEKGYYIVATYPEDGESYEELIESLKLYSKQKGKHIPIL